MNKVQLFLFVTILGGCAASLPPAERVSQWEDWMLCHKLADFAYKSDSEWLWYTSAEINKRNLDQDARCKSVFDSRISAFARKHQKNSINITFENALNKNTNFEDAVAK